ncbi:MAG: HlyD family efflux transporter periplasmic adaptor subunit, partial [Planctomycetota bacterium]
TTTSENTEKSPTNNRDALTKRPEPTYDGIVRFEKRAKLTFGVPGRISSIDVKPGDRVTAGQSIGKLDNRVALATVNEANARACAAGAITVAKSDLKRAEMQLSTARQANRSGREAFSGNRMKQLEIALQRAKAAVQVEKDNLMIADAAAEVARSSVEVLALVAPFDGLIVNRFKQAGEGVDTVTPVVEIVSSTLFRIEFFIPYGIADKTNIDQIVLILPADSLDEDGEKSKQSPIEAHIQFVDPSVQTVRNVTRVVAVYSVDNSGTNRQEDVWLCDGLPVRVTIR